MKYMIKGREIRWLCSSHGLQYGNQKRLNAPLKKRGICDICEVTGSPKANQTVFAVGDFQGLMVQDSNGLITIKK